MRSRSLYQSHLPSPEPPAQWQMLLFCIESTILYISRVQMLCQGCFDSVCGQYLTCPLRMSDLKGDTPGGCDADMSYSSVCTIVHALVPDLQILLPSRSLDFYGHVSRASSHVRGYLCGSPSRRPSHACWRTSRHLQADSSPYSLWQPLLRQLQRRTQAKAYPTAVVQEVALL